MKKFDEEYIQKKIMYRFNDVDLLYQAFKRHSWTEENGGEDNENLELIGDSILYMYVTKYLTEHFGYFRKYSRKEFCFSNNYDEGDLTNIRIGLIERKYLSLRIEEMEVKKYLFLGTNDTINNEQNVEKVKCDLFEAILGAIAIDCKWEQNILQKAVENMLNIDKFIANNCFSDIDYIALLLQWNIKKYGESIYYLITDNSDKTKNACVVISTSKGDIKFLGNGRNATLAKCEAAKKAYKYLEDNNELFNIDNISVNDITIENSINKLQELAQKGHLPMPKYFIKDEINSDENGNKFWECTCFLSPSIKTNAKGFSKKIAKKNSAYLTLKKILNIN